nr:uncharacterized mitochondrial protein AtMg00810-like [Tanacetum cinerariifolium]
LQVKQKKDGIFSSQDKYVAEILKKFGLSEGKSASTLIDAEKPLLKDSDGEDVDVHTYSLVRNVDSSSKFYMYPRFIQLIIQNLVGDLSTHTTRFISPALTQKVFANTRRVGKGFSGVETPLSEGMLAVGQPEDEGLVAEQVHVDDVAAAAVEENVAENVSHATIPSPPPHDIPSPSQDPSSPPQQQQKNDNAAQKLVIVKLKVRVKKLEKANTIKSSKLRRLRKVRASRRVESSANIEDVFNQGRMIDDMDMNEGIELVKDAEVVESEGRHAAQQVEKRAKIYNLDLDHSLKVLSMQEDDSEVQEVVEVVTTAKLITEVVTAVASQVSAASITIPAASATIPTAAQTDKGKGILVETSKLMKKKDQIKMDAEYAKKLQEEIDRDHDGFSKDIDWDATMDHVNKKSKAQEAEDLRKRLEVVENEDDDVFVNATPLAQSFATLLKNFDREDLETLWRIVKDKFSTSKPANFSNEYILLTLKTMFEEPDGQDAIWRNQKSVHGLALVKRWKMLTSCGVHVITLSTVQLFLLVERRYPLLRFTLEQLLLELMLSKRSKKNTMCINAVSEELTAAKHKLMLLVYCC